MAVQKYGLDLGTGNIKIYKEGKGLVLKEKNMIAIRKKVEMVAFGDAAYDMYERCPENIRVISPVKNGVIAGLSDMIILLDLFLRKIKCSNGIVRSNEFYLSVPTAITEVEKRAFFDLAMGSEFKSKDLFIVEKPIAAAIGENIDVMRTPGLMVIDFGADSIEIAILALGGIVSGRLLKTGGNAINEAIISAVKEKYHLLIGMKTAENLKLEIGSASGQKQSFMKVLGRDLVSGLPAKATVTSDVVYEPIRKILAEVVQTAKDMREHTPPEIFDAILNEGTLITGEGSRMEHIKSYFEEELKIPVLMTETPDQSVVKGLGTIMKDDKFKRLAFSSKEAIFS